MHNQTKNYFFFCTVLLGSVLSLMLTNATLAQAAPTETTLVVQTTAQVNAANTDPAQTAEMSQAEVRRVDIANQKITLKHGEIKNLDMPGMTMVFVAKDPTMLVNLKAGDKVVFTAEKINSAFVVTQIKIAQ